MATRNQDGRQQVEYADQQVERGHGGETHQVAGDGAPPLTTQQGIAGRRRPEHAAGRRARADPARGLPLPGEDLPLRPRADPRAGGARPRLRGPRLSSRTTSRSPSSPGPTCSRRPGQHTPVFVRFSTVAGNKGSADLARDVRGFAVKFYTREGNWDLVGNNIPVFFIQDAIKFPDLIHAAKQEPDRGFPQAQTAHDNFWDFVSLMPESTHMLMWIMSDRAIPRSFRFMEGFGVHTFRLVNAERRSPRSSSSTGSRSWACSRWCGTRRSRSTAPTPTSTAATCGTPSPRATSRSGSSACSSSTTSSPTGSTSTCSTPPRSSPRRRCRSARVGRLVLDRVVDNFFAETEQVAFCTQNIVPGIDFTNDPLLQGRNFSYLDTQLKRLGSPNFTHLPINAPKCPFAHFQQDGHMAMVNPTGRVNYEPNSWGADGGPAGGSGPASPALPGRSGHRGRAEAPAAAGELRRPLQPGPPVLRQPDPGRAAAHRRRVRVRAEQMRQRLAIRAADGGRPAQRRRRPGRRQVGRRAWA